MAIGSRSTFLRRWRTGKYVFTVPRLLRPMFARRREWLGELCRIAARALVKGYHPVPDIA